MVSTRVGPPATGALTARSVFRGVRPAPTAGRPATEAAVADDDFAEFATARWDRLVRFAVMLTGDFHEAEDLVQTTLIKVHHQWRRLRSGDLDAYVRRALINNNRSRHRRRRVAQLLMPSLPDDAAQSDGGSRIEERDELMRLLATLPRRQRDVLVLRFWEDLTEEQVADALGCSVGTVKSHTSRAMAKLRAHPLLPSLAGTAYSGDVQ